MEKAKLKAFEGGYNANFAKWKWTPDQDIPDDWMLLDPLFWQALGKAEGWTHFTSNAKATTHKNCTEFCIWKEQWHSFIDHLAEGKDADSFFTNLLK